jgi:hypothetical protein
MSSIALPPLHFNSVEIGIYKAFFVDSKIGFSPYRYTELNTLKLKDPQEVIEALMDEVRLLSALCISLQYKHHYPGTLDKEIETHQKKLLNSKDINRSLSLVGLYKAIQSIDYQIELQHLKDLRGLTDMEEVALSWIKKVEEDISEIIITKLPEYESSDWIIE